MGVHGVNNFILLYYFSFNSGNCTIEFSCSHKKDTFDISCICHFYNRSKHLICIFILSEYWGVMNHL